MIFPLIFPLISSAQPINNFTKGVSVVNPNAASLGKYTDIPVNLSTGVPSISIPIHTITEGNLSLPISLSYHASGVKVNEMASWVGSGWSLMAGGSVSRTILGLPDDDPTDNRGFFYNTFRDKSTLGSTPDLTGPELENVRDGKLDTEADLFSFNFNGNSGKFFFDAQGKSQIIPKQDLKILMRTASHPEGRETIDKTNKDLITGFIIITTDGTKYYFEDVETTKQGSTFFGIGFHLTTISSYDEVNEIYFTYSNQNINTASLYEMRNLAIAQRIFSNNSAITQHLGSVCTIEAIPDRFSQIVSGFFTNVETVNEVLPTSITTKSGNTTINFVQSSRSYLNQNNGVYSRKIEGSREDVEYIIPARVNNDQYSAPYLAQIDIKEGSFCHSKQLSYNYFKDARAAFQDKPWAKRLRLEEVKISEGSTCGTPTTTIGTYKLNYTGDVVNPTSGNVTTRASMIHRMSRATDHWGYYNGKLQNDDAANLSGLNIPPTTVGSFTHGNSDRSSDEESMKQGVLSKIIYPTGGSTTFEFEANKVKTPISDNIVCLEGDNNNIHNQRFFTLTNSTGNLGILKLEKTTPTVLCIITVFNGTTSLWTTTQPYTWLAGETKKELAVTLPTNLPINANLKITLQTNSAATFCIYRAQTSTELTVGGLRIKKSIFRPLNSDDNKIETDYQYTLTDGGSSGVLVTGIPTYGFFNTLNGISQAPGAPIPPSYFVPTVVMQSVPTSPLGNYEGYHVAYKQVTVSQTNNGKSIYYYETEAENTDKSFPVAPFQFRKNNGHLTSDQTYKKDGASDVLIGSSNYIPTTEGLNGANYSFKVVTINAARQSSIDNPAIWPSPTCIFNGTITPIGCTPAICSNLAESALRNSALLGILYQKYKIKTSVYRLKSVTKVMDNVSTTTENTYYTEADRTLSPIVTIVTNSDGKQQKTTNKFIHEYAGSEVAIGGGADNTKLVSANVKTWMLNNNMIATPVETTVEYNNVVIGGTRTVFGFATITGTYSDVTTTKSVYPFKYYAYEPISTTFNNSWQLKGSIDDYNTTVWLPNNFKTKGYAQSETYQWFSNSVLKQKAFNGLAWNYTYHPNTRLLASVVNENQVRSEFLYDNLLRLSETKLKDINNANTKSTTSYYYNFGGIFGPTSNYVGTFIEFSNAPSQTTVQYFDGLGRPISSIREGYTPNYLHQKNNITYDALGRQDRVYQPFEGASTGYEAIALSVPRNDKPYMNTEYEPSPLGRPIKKFMEDGSCVKMEYGSNYATYPVRQFTVSMGTNGNFHTIAPISTNFGNFGDNLLSRVTTWDENANTSEPEKGRTDIFTDKLGRMILTRKFVKNPDNSYRNVDTYNLYDDFSNLIAVIPPDVLSSTGTIAPADYSLIFQYKYDNQNRLCSKLIPGATVQEIFYDNRDLVVITQDGKQRVENKVLATIYDDLGRNIKTGFISTSTTGSTRTTIETYITNNNGVPNAAITDILTETSFVPSRSLIAQTKAKVMGYKKATDADFITSTFEYDNYARSYSTTSNTHINKYNNQYAPLDDADKPTANFHSWVGTDNEYKATLQYNYYDNALRPTYTYHSILLENNNWYNQTPQRHVSYTRYDEKDRLIEKNLGGTFDWNTWSTKYLQSIDYKFNNRNWLTAINEGYLPSTGWGIPYPVADCNEISNWYGWGNYPTPGLHYGDQNPDMYAQSIRYDNPEAALPNSTPARSNGDITQIQWQVAGREAQAYSYAYDNINRMTDANYTDLHNTSWWYNTGAYSTDNKYQEKIQYEDARGNIKKITRRGLDYPSSFWGIWCGTFNIIDDVTFSYNTKNQITTVAENAPSWTAHKGFKHNPSAGAYIYDDNGNLKKDDHKNIVSIDYNYLNLPEKITFTNNRIIEFTYDATGKKWRKRVTEPGQNAKERDYIDGVEYTIDYTSNGAVIKQDIIHFTEGYAQRDPATDGDPNWKGWIYKYTIKDHLGNTRVTFDDFNNDGNITTDDVKQVNNYYPFGMNMEGNWNGADGQFKYQFNGTEWNDDFGLGWSDYTKRWYDPTSNRFWSVDMLATKFAYYSPYQYAGNRVPNAIDLDGMEELIINKMPRQQFQYLIQNPQGQSRVGGGITPIYGTANEVNGTRQDNQLSHNSIPGASITNRILINDLDVNRNVQSITVTDANQDATALLRYGTRQTAQMTSNVFSDANFTGIQIDNSVRVGYSGYIKSAGLINSDNGRSINQIANGLLGNLQNAVNANDITYNIQVVFPDANALNTNLNNITNSINAIFPNANINAIVSQQSLINGLNNNRQAPSYDANGNLIAVGISLRALSPDNR